MAQSVILFTFIYCKYLADGNEYYILQKRSMTMRLNDISYLSQFDFLQTKEEKKKKGKKEQRLSV